ncbi:MAG TPA: hypothetical protein VIK59_11730 [Verrucomicrobiae bacterium]
METAHNIEVQNQKMLKHSFSLYTLTGEAVFHPFCREDLFDVITGMERYVVDNSRDWKKESRKLENASKIFIVGRTVSEETENLKSVFHGDKVDVSNNNIFNFSLNDLLYGKTLVWIERVDKAFLSVIDLQKLQEETKPFAKRTDESFIRWRKERLVGIERTKRKILDILDVDKIADLAPRDELSELEMRLSDYIQTNSSHCFCHWINSAMVAECCYALLLVRDRKIRNEFANPDYLNVFGDTMLVHNALYFRSKIFSNDFAPKEMARYLGDQDILCANKIP